MTTLVFSGSKEGGVVSLQQDDVELESRAWERGPHVGRDILVGLEEILRNQNLTVRDIGLIRVQGAEGESSAERMVRVTAQTISAAIGVPVEQENQNSQ